MQNIKFHILSFVSAIFFAYSLSVFVISIISFNISDRNIKSSFFKKNNSGNTVKNTYTVDQILQTNFFKIASDSETPNMPSQNGNIDDLKLMGTVTGPSSISRAMILKKGERQSEVFRLWKDVYGYKLIAINFSNVKLKHGQEVYTLDLYEKKDFKGKPERSSNSVKSGTVKKQISKSEIQQKVLNNLDNAMKGLRAGPYRVNGKIEGYRLIRVRPYNILYKYGIRSGDILKRINGKKINSTEKLYGMWQGIKEQTRLNVDIERRGKTITYDINITD